MVLLQGTKGVAGRAGEDAPGKQTVVREAAGNTGSLNSAAHGAMSGMDTIFFFLFSLQLLC